MPHFYFDIKDGHRQVDSSGLDFKNDGRRPCEGRSDRYWTFPRQARSRSGAAYYCSKWLKEKKFSGCQFILSRQ
jgi:hypothetical protein